jgi:hypothetical protein
VKTLVGVVLAVAAISCACEGTKSVAPPTTATSAKSQLTENQWLGRYALWVTDLRVALVHADRPALEGCANTLDRELGEPPASLRTAEAVLTRACHRFADGARLHDRRRSFLEWSQGARLVWAANRRLPTRQAMERLPLPAGRGPVAESRVEPFFTEVARDIAAPVGEVRCWSRADWAELQKETFGRDHDLAGFASPGFQRVNLAWDICDSLAELAYTKERPTGIEELKLAFAVTTLMHESGHLNESGDFYGAGANEPLAECWGLQHIRQAAMRLGATRAYADELAERYWTEVYPTRPAGYRSKKCRDGGAYDIRKDSSVWP